MPASDQLPTQISYQVPPALMEQVQEILDLNRAMLREVTTGRYLTTEQAAAYLKRSTSYFCKVVAKQVPALQGSPDVYDIRDLDAWFAAAKKHRQSCG